MSSLLPNAFIGMNVNVCSFCNSDLKKYSIKNTERVPILIFKFSSEDFWKFKYDVQKE